MPRWVFQTSQNGKCKNKLYFPCDLFCFVGCGGLINCVLKEVFLLSTMKVSVLNTVDTAHEDMIVSMANISQLLNVKLFRLEILKPSVCDDSPVIFSHIGN